MCCAFYCGLVSFSPVEPPGKCVENTICVQEIFWVCVGLTKCIGVGNVWYWQIDCQMCGVD